MKRIEQDMFWLCNECDRKVHDSTLLVGKHPFRSDEPISGCSHCGSLAIIPACGVNKCHEEATSGQPTEEGYKWLCYEHAVGFRLEPHPSPNHDVPIRGERA